MEIIRKISNDKNIKTIDSQVYGTVEELISSKNIYSNKSAYVIKPSEGAMSKGISLAKDFKQLLADAKKISATPSLIIDLIDRMRTLKHKGYIKESTHRKKFVVQDFIPNLQGDWKVLIYWNKFYVLRRLNREKDFRASGGGRLSYTRDIPNGMLDYAKSIIKHLNLPNVSLDIAFDGKTFYLLEFQAVYFGTYTLEHSSFYFSFNKEWEIVEKKSILEDEYVRSIISYIDNDLKYLE
ncbi:ATP-grasp domain-containing protein [Tenuifilum thalassicum]|uniref:ATP-grasp domain-containing protein n=1 Tax=Tenuifilum thalassicum TaxID=2590900 RepID=A0A7D4C779_9BACT|nr:hypothetical protein [Tenuifilum thalassicum]QKG78802.1 hypothetical protein FHG85_00465 [Tenuifilum thalassicum]